MKAILYAGAALMVGASIYGFVDYKKTSHKKQFTGMYNDVREKATPSVKEPVVLHKEISVLPENQTTKKNVKPGKVKKKSIVTKTTEKPITTVVSEKKVVPVKIKKNRKPINAKFFSRAPIREEMEDEVILPVTEKTDTKMEIKKQ